MVLEPLHILNHYSALQRVITCCLGRLPVAKIHWGFDLASKSFSRLQVAAGLMSGALTGVFCAARLMLFVGGSSTCGGGMIVNTELSEAIRSHKVSLLGVNSNAAKFSCSVNRRDVPTCCSNLSTVL